MFTNEKWHEKFLMENFGGNNHNFIPIHPDPKVAYDNQSVALFGGTDRALDGQFQCSNNLLIGNGDYDNVCCILSGQTSLCEHNQQRNFNHHCFHSSSSSSSKSSSSTTATSSSLSSPTIAGRNISNIWPTKQSLKLSRKKFNNLINYPQQLTIISGNENNYQQIIDDNNFQHYYYKHKTEMSENGNYCPVLADCTDKYNRRNERKILMENNIQHNVNVDEEEEEEEEDDIIVDHFLDYSRIGLKNNSNEQQWSLVPKQANQYSLTMIGKENNVYFIGIDTSLLHLRLFNNENNDSGPKRIAVLVFVNKTFHIKDLNSAFGTYINEQRIPSRCFIQLNEFDEIRFGCLNNANVYQLKRIEPQPQILQASKIQQQPLPPLPPHHRQQTIIVENNNRKGVGKNIVDDNNDVDDGEDVEDSHLEQHGYVEENDNQVDDDYDDFAVDDVDDVGGGSCDGGSGRNGDGHSSVNLPPLPHQHRRKSASVSMNKLFRNIGKNNALNNKNTMENKKSTMDKDVEQCFRNKNSKLSPSSFSLMSSSSSNSSSTTCSSSINANHPNNVNNNNNNVQHHHPTSPSSVFMTAMKMMKTKFKKKSPKEKALICSGNDDITFIRYDKNNLPVSGAGRSISAPESPNQLRNRTNYSQTYQNKYPHLRKLSAYQIDITFEEHEYDEVTREDEDDALIGTENNNSCYNPSTISGDTLVKEQTIILPTTVSVSSNLDNNNTNVDDYNDNNDGTLCRKMCDKSTLSSSSLSSSSSFTKSVNVNLPNKDIYIEQSKNNIENIDLQHQHHNVNEEDEEGDQNEQILSLETMAKQFKNDNNIEINEQLSTIINENGHNNNKTKTFILPHLNSEDRLNNNSSLDMLLANESSSSSLMANNTCEPMINNHNNGNNNNSTCSLDSNRKDENVLYSSTNHNQRNHSTNHLHHHYQHQNSQHMDEYHRINVIQKESTIENNNKDSVTFGARIIPNRGNNFTSLSNNNNNNNNNNGGTGIVARTNVTVKCIRCTDCDQHYRNNLHNNHNYDNIFSAKETFFEKNAFSSYSPQPPTQSPHPLPKTANIAKDYELRRDICLTGNINKINGATLDCQNDSDSAEATTEESEYDIDDIGHLRRPLVNSTLGKAEQSLEHCKINESNQDRAHSRHSIGGMAFVIDFNDGDNTKSDKVCERRSTPSILYNRKKYSRNSNVNQTKSICTDGEEESSKSMIRLNSKRNRYVSNNSANGKKLINTNDDNDENDDVVFICQQSTDDNIDGQEVEEQTFLTKPNSSLKKSDTFDKKISKLIGVDSLQSSNSTDETVKIKPPASIKNDYCSSSLKNVKNKNSLDSVGSECSLKAASSSTSSQPQRGGAQLSESAVYLINRMFEDNDNYHHRCYDNDNQYISYNNGPRSHQSVLSSDSESPYGSNRFNQADHQHHHSQAVSHHNVCDSSNASTRMEYDDSLSSLHSNVSDSAQRLAHLQSMSTVIPSSPQSTLDKQVDSAIDDDGDLIPDDISDTGTYVVEIDEHGHKHRKHDISKKEQKNTLTAKKELNENVRSSDEDLAGIETNSDYEEDFDYEDSNQDGEDKLEAARKRIDELFSNYERNQTQKQQIEDNNKENNFTNNATFTRCKRTNSCDQNNLIETKCSTVSVETPSITENVLTNDKSKKRISSELMSAFKRINAKLEKTARLGKLSMSDNNNETTPNIPVYNQSNITTTTNNNSKVPIKCHSAPGTPQISSTVNRKRIIITKAALSRKSSNASSEYSSTEKLDDQPSSMDTNRSRARSESVTSNTTNQSSSLRFNRAFALRRARLGMDTCGVELSEQSACKAKESQQKMTPKKPQLPTFRRNDGGRFSLRVNNNEPNKTSAKTTPRIVNTSKQPTVNRQCSKPLKVESKIPTIKSYSASSSVCSSNENLCNSKKLPENHVIRKHKPQQEKLVAKISHSDNEIIADAGDSSCDETVMSPFTRFGRSSLRCSSLASSSTPWLKSLKANNTPSNSTLAGKSQATAYPLYSSPSNSRKNSLLTQTGHCFSEGEIQEPETPTPVDSVRSIPGFQMGKRFFSTKPHRMAQFDKEFPKLVGRSISANSNQLSPDHNLMTHSVTESLLTRNISNNVSNQDKFNEHPLGSDNLSISPSINARIFRISPLDSLVISAINQLASKLRTRMRNFLERERLNHLVGSEARTLIDEILPQVSAASTSNNRSNVCKNPESSNISRDLSNILKNLKKVEQIFDVFYTLLEPNVNCQEVTGEHEVCTGITTNASDSDTSGESTSNNIQVVTSKPPSAAVKPLPIKSRYSTAYGQSSGQQSQSPPASEQTRSGFFIEI